MDSSQEVSSNPPAPLTLRGTLIVAGFLLFLIAGGTVSILAAFWSGSSVASRFLLLLMASTCLAFPFWIAFALVRRKIKSGRYFPTPEERAATRARTVWQFRSPKYRRNIRALYGALTLFWIGIGTLWIRSAIHNPDKRLWAVYWVTLAMFNVIWMVRMAMRPAFGIEPGSGAGTS